MKTTIPPTHAVQPDAEELYTLVELRMPFGKYKGTLLIDLPEPYVVWFKRQGFPNGKLGRALETLFEVKVNGLEPLVRRLKDKSPRHTE